MRTTIFVLAVMISSLISQISFADINKPNIILISVDAMRPDHMSCYGYNRNTTPNIDKIAEKGVIFTDASCLVPLTNPSISTLFTSLTPDENGVNRNGIPLPQGTKTLVNILGDHGYSTAAVVNCWSLHGSKSGLKDSFDYYMDGSTNVFLERNARESTRVSRKLLDTKLTEPFFLWVHYSDPHQPHTPRVGYLPKNIGLSGTELSEKRNMLAYGYDSELSYVDYWIGDLLKSIENDGISERTMLIIMADHGEGLGEKGASGHGRWLYQHILRIPLIVSGPLVPQGAKIDIPVHVLDVSPTILSYLNMPKLQKMEGRDLSPLMINNIDLMPKPFYFETYSVAVPDVPGFKKMGANSKPTAVGMRVGDLKITYSLKNHTFFIYDLKNDPNEETNLYDQEIEWSKFLSEKLKEHYELNIKDQIK